jgi:hypothetical protein
MQALINKIKKSHPTLKFRVGHQFYWSPETSEIVYKDEGDDKVAVWSLLHETGHAMLEHQTYKYDFELVRLEMEAWEKAKGLAKEIHETINEEHIQDCLDTYRDWLFRRSICPNCTAKCLQQGDIVHYRCFNCHTTWKVSSSRFCRSYRRSKNVASQPLVHFKVSQ